MRAVEYDLLIRVEVVDVGIGFGEQASFSDDGSFFIASSYAREVEAAIFGTLPCALTVSDHLREHEALLDHFIERALLAWTRSRT